MVSSMENCTTHHVLTKSSVLKEKEILYKMNILVCVKQVPDTNNVKLDPVTNTMIRQGVPSILNPWDGYALEIALKLKEKHGAKITVLSMGPKQAEDTLRECLAVGADEAVLLSDRAFGGADTLATSYALAAAIKKMGPFDLLMFGKQAFDGDSAQVGPVIAELLELPQITYVYDVEVDGENIVAKSETEDGYEVMTSPTPVVLTAIRAADLRLPNIKSKMAARKKEIPVMTAADVDVSPCVIGLAGSPTQVKKVFPPPVKGTSEVITPEDAKSAATAIIAQLKSKYVI